MTHLIKRSHRLIRAPYLHLIKERLPTITSLPRTLRIRLINIIPSPLASQHILNLLPLHLLPLIIFFVDEELVGAGAAFETVLALGVGARGVGGVGAAAGDGEGVGAAGTDLGEGTLLAESI